MMIDSICQAGLSIDPVVNPLAERIVAWRFVNGTLPKIGKGSTEPDVGASAIHSADNRAAEPVVE